MGRILTKVADCKYREYNRLLTEKFIVGLKDGGMTDEILSKVAMLEDIREATSECILTWVCRAEMQRTKRIVLNSIMEAKESDLVKYQKRECETMHSDRYRYFGTGHAPQ